MPVQGSGSDGRFSGNGGGGGGGMAGGSGGVHIQARQGQAHNGASGHRGVSQGQQSDSYLAHPTAPYYYALSLALL